MKQLYTLNVNGEPQEVAAHAHHSLLEVLRYDLGLTGSKQGCDKGDCGACTVLVDGQPTLACCTLAITHQGKAITTIEGVADASGPSPVQRAFDACGALQCGFCQPGMILSATALLAEDPDPDLDRIKQALSGNLCRCTGYTKIYEAVRAAADASRTLPESAPGQPFPRQVPMTYGEPTDGFRVIDIFLHNRIRRQRLYSVTFHLVAVTRLAQLQQFHAAGCDSCTACFPHQTCNWV